jgi:hypothetical protein
VTPTNDFKDEKVCFSRVGRDFKFDYSVTFADCQRLQQIRKKLLKALLSLENNLAIAKGCETIYKRLSALHKSSPRAPASLELHLHILDLKSHIRTVNSILEHASWVAVMVGERSKLDNGLRANFYPKLKDILDYRHDEAIRVNSQSLRDIASDSNRESQIIATITKEGAADSKSLKALTILATLYLPASLFAVCNFICVTSEDITDKIRQYGARTLCS